MLPIHSQSTRPGIASSLMLLAVLSCGLAAAAHQNRTARFDRTVRGVMFAGMAGDSEALARAMKLCDERLARDPLDAEALVWHGSGLIYQGGQSIRAGDFAKGKPSIARGLREMDEAVANSPDHVEVLIPRGATLLEYSKHDPSAERARASLEKALADFERVLDLQKPVWSQTPTHSRGELLSGLAEGWLRAGNAPRARSYMERLVKETSGSAYAKRAQTFLNAPVSASQLDWHCLGCHATPEP